MRRLKQFVRLRALSRRLARLASPACVRAWTEGGAPSAQERGRPAWDSEAVWRWAQDPSRFATYCDRITRGIEGLDGEWSIFRATGWLSDALCAECRRQTPVETPRRIAHGDHLIVRREGRRIVVRHWCSALVANCPWGYPPASQSGLIPVRAT